MAKVLVVFCVMVNDGKAKTNSPDHRDSCDLNGLVKVVGKENANHVMGGISRNELVVVPHPNGKGKDRNGRIGSVEILLGTAKMNSIKIGVDVAL